MKYVTESKHIRSSKWASLLIIIALVFIVFPINVSSKDYRGGIPGEWITHYKGARTIGLGGAFVAVADEPIGALWNPAGLARLFQNEAYLETVRLFEGTSINCLSVAVPGSKYPTIGLSVLSLHSGEFEQTNDVGAVTGHFREGDIAFILSTSKRVGSHLMVGAGTRIVRQSIDDFNDTGIGFDCGLLCDITPMFSIGLSVLNMAGPTLELREAKETFPVEIRGGIAARMLSNRLLVTMEIDQYSPSETSFHIGAAFKIHPRFTIRVGGNQFVPTGGISVNLPKNMVIDYGLNDNELGVAHRISLSYQFGGFFAGAEPDREVFSPLGRNPLAKFNLQTRTREIPKRWFLEIVDNSGQGRRSFKGKGSPPADIVWDGKDGSGNPLPDGVYYYKFYVDDGDGQKIEGHGGVIEIDTGIRTISAPVTFGKTAGE